jgi:hypothetical protein
MSVSVLCGVLLVGRNNFLLVIALMLSIVFLLTPFVVRSLQGNDALLGQESYFYLGAAQNVLVPESYPLSDMQTTLFDLLVASLLLFIPPMLVAKLLPVALGFLALLLFFLQSHKFLSENELAASSMLFLISPLFLVMFTSLSPFCLVLVIVLLSWLLYDKFPVLSLVVAGLLLFVDGLSFVFLVLLLFAYGFLHASWKPAAIGGMAGMVVLVALDLFAGFFASQGIISSLSFSDFFANLGADFGYSFFILFLALTGIIGVWSRKNTHIGAIVVLCSVFLFSFSSASARVVFLPVSALLAGKGIIFLVKREWKVDSIRYASLFLVGLSLLFTLVFTITDRVDEEPSFGQLKAYQFLQSVPEGEVVLSQSANGIFIERIGRRDAFLDEVKSEYSWERDVAAHRMFMATRLDMVEDLLTEYHISHILIDENMRSGAVWTHEEQGLLFLLDHSTHFVKLYDADGVMVYRYLGKEKSDFP